MIKKAGVAIGGVVVILLAIATGHFLFTRNNRGDFDGNSTLEEWSEYTHEDGFSLSYPVSMELSQEENGITLSGDGEMSFVVGKLNGGPLRSVVVALANSFGIESESLETFTVNSRTGYKLTHNGVVYYYFPLFDDNYLEVADKGENKKEEVVMSLKFIAPTRS